MMAGKCWASNAARARSPEKNGGVKVEMVKVEMAKGRTNAECVCRQQAQSAALKSKQLVGGEEGR